jgi:uncharacterized protein YunC (DUF1805 family)
VTEPKEFLMIHEKISLAQKVADGYVIPLGIANVVAIVTDVGMVGCGAFDVGGMDKLNYPAAKVGGKQGSPVVTLTDLLEGIVKEVNRSGGQRGIRMNMTGREALELL